MEKQWRRNTLSCLMALVLLIPLFPSSSISAATPLSQAQITAQGSTRYYNTSGSEVASGSPALGSNNVVVSVNKTIAGTDIENEFVINLTVNTTKVLSDVKTPTPDAAVVLIFDTSSLMSSYLASMKTAAINFLTSYAKDAEASSRYVSLVAFGTTATVKSGWVDVANAANLTSLKNQINGLTTSGNTFMEGALVLTRNLLRTDVLPKAVANRSVIMFTKGVPNEYGIPFQTADCYTNMSINAYNTFDGTPGCFGNGNSYALSAANAVKSGNAFVVNTYNVYTKYSANIYTVAYGTDGTAKAWLRDNIASSSSYAYDASAVSQLNDIFAITKQVECRAQAGIVTDTMGNNIEFIQTISSTESSFLKFANNTLEWNLNNVSPTVNNNIYTYSYSYRIRLNTAASAFVANTAIPINGTSKLNYVMIVGGVTQGTTLTANFSIPSVKGYHGAFNFLKASDKGANLAGCAFKLENTTAGKPGYSATSAANGSVGFNAIPSGYTYKLTETSLPDNLKDLYQLSDEVLTVTVSLGNVVIKNSKGVTLSTGFTFVNLSKKLITKEYKDSAGNKLQSDETKLLSVGAIFSDAPVTITGYTYNGYRINGGALTAGTPSFTLAAGDSDKTVTYVYSINTYGITVKYQDRAGNQLRTDTTASAAYKSVYSASNPGISGYTLVDWKNNGVSQGNKSPSFTVPASNVTVILVYALDRDGNGTEDILITKEYKDNAGTRLLNDETKIVNAGTTFSDAPAAISGYNYNGYRINNGSLTAGTPAFAVAAGDPNKTVTYVYSINSYSITVKYQDRAGNQLKADTTAAAVYGSAYSASNPGITGYTFVDWKYDGVSQGNKSPSFTVPAAHVTVILVYGRDRDGNGTEDILVTKEYKDKNSGNKLRNDETKIVNVGSTFSDSYEIITGYTYSEYQIDNTTPRAGTPSFTVASGDRDKTVTYFYSINQYSITVQYQTRAGSQLKADTTASAVYGSAYSVSVPGFAGYALEDWKLNGAWQGNISPSFAVPAENVTVILVYGPEKIQITKKYVDTAERPLRDSETKTLEVGTSFGDPPEEILWHTYLGYQIDGSALAQGTPAFTVAAGDSDKIVTYIYDPDQDITVIKTVTNLDGDSIDGGEARERDILRYTIRIEADKALSAVGPVTVEDVLPPEIRYTGEHVKMVTGTDSVPVYLDPEDGSNILIHTNRYLNNVGDWLELTFDVAVLDGSAGKEVKNIAEGSAANLFAPRQSNVTAVTILARETGDLTITKQDSLDANKKLNGAVFEIWDTATDVKVTTTAPTQNGTVTVTSLPFGNYRFVEITTPTGYKAPPDGNITTALLQDTSALKGADDGTFTVNEGIEAVIIKNMKISNVLSFTKIDGNSYAQDEIIPIPGAEFAIFRCPNPGASIPLVPDEVIQGTGTSPDWEPVMVNPDGTGPVPYRVKSDANGVVTFLLENGAYMLVETYAPTVNGYQYILPSGQWAFAVMDFMNPPIMCMGIPDEQGQSPPAFTEENQLLNYRQHALPVSGGTGTKAFIWGGSLLAGSGIALLLIRSRSISYRFRRSIHA